MATPSFPIETERLRLRLFTADDLEALHALYGDPDAVRYVPRATHSLDEAAELLERRRGETRLADGDDDAFALAVVLRETGELIGEMSLFWHDRETRTGELGFIFHRDHQRRGYGREAGLATLELGFGTLELRRIIACADARNAASSGLLERLGMRREAHLVESWRIKGEWADEVVYALLAREWPTEAANRG